MDKPATKAFIELKHEKDIVRIWIDIHHKPYKVELRLARTMGYFEPDEFMKKLAESYA